MSVVSFPHASRADMQADRKNLHSNNNDLETSKNVEQSSNGHQQVTIAKAPTKEPNAARF